VDNLLNFLRHLRIRFESNITITKTLKCHSKITLHNGIKNNNESSCTQDNFLDHNLLYTNFNTTILGLPYDGSWPLHRTLYKTQLGLGVNKYDHQSFPEQSTIDLVDHNSPFNPLTLNTSSRYFASSFADHYNFCNIKMVAFPAVNLLLSTALGFSKMTEHWLCDLPTNNVLYRSKGSSS